MREWPANHPKAKLVARNRRAIVDAARATFLRHGYAGTGMEAVASAAGVSIMTLYRHAKSKDELFGAVIAASCEPESEDHQAMMEDALARPLEEVLASVGTMFRARLVDPDTLALFRTVMVEADRFPQLGPLAYQGFVGVHVEMMKVFLAQHPDTRDLPPDRCRRLATEFLGSFIGLSYVGAMLGAAEPTVEEDQGRPARAIAAFLAGLQGER